MASDDGVEGLFGEWHPPRTSTARAARLQASEGHLKVLAETGELLTEGPLSKVEISHRVGSVPRRFTFADGSQFVTRDNDGADALLQSLGQGRGWHFVHGLEQVRPRLAVMVLAVILFAMAIYRYALPALVELAVLITPPVVPQLMSSSVLKSLDQVVFSDSKLDAARKAKISEGFAAIAARSPEGASAYNLNFRTGGRIGPNAFALPDGTLVLTDELVDLAGDDDDMIIGVLAHEIGHVEHKHSLRQLYRAAGTVGLIMLIAGDVGSATEDILTQGGGLLALSYSRDAEREADSRSAELMLAAGRDPQALMRFFEVIQKKLGDGEGPGILSTHPPTEERRQAIAAYVETLRKKQAP